MFEITYFENYNRYTEQFTREQAEQEVIECCPMTPKQVQSLSDSALYELLNQIFNG